VTTSATPRHVGSRESPASHRNLALRLGLVPNDEEARAEAQQTQLTIADLVAEVHDLHHPIASSIYYEDRK
jgi:glutathione S-transferase